MATALENDGPPVEVTATPPGVEAPRDISRPRDSGPENLSGSFASSVVLSLGPLLSILGRVHHFDWSSFSN